MRLQPNFSRRVCMTSWETKNVTSTRLQQVFTKTNICWKNSLNLTVSCRLSALLNLETSFTPFSEGKITEYHETFQMLEIL